MAKVSLINTYQKYPAYKDSGVEWLGDVPEEWKIEKLKYAAPLYSKKVPGKNGFGTYVALENVESWSGKHVSSQNVVEPESIVNVFESDDILFGKLRPYLAKVFQPNFKGTATGEFLVLRPSKRISKKYLFYRLLSPEFINTVNDSTYGSQMPRASWSFVGDLPITIPDFTQQERIAEFLDEQTARIDESISKKQRLIELLKEKRTAIINNAVTKGLDPKADLVDSGVEWIGKIPKGWEVIKMKFLTKKPLQYGINEAAESENTDDVRFIRITDVKADGTLRDDTFKSLPLEVARPYLLNEGDILFARTGATAGKSFMYKKEWGKCCFAGYLIRLSTKEEKVDHNFLNLVTYSDYYLQWTKSVFIQSTIQNISAEKYKEFNVALPAVDIQKRIVYGIKSDLKSINLAQVKIKNSILLLKEFKSSLISHAVTGKIKV